jgi:hypothetical protein
MMMERGLRILSSMLLMGALAVPVALRAQDHDDHNNNRDDHGQQRVYDRQNKDFHQWNDNEDRVYRQWYGESHNGRAYREYSRLNKRDQDAYWKWRHQHGDDRHDDDHHNDDHHSDHR